MFTPETVMKTTPLFALLFAAFSLSASAATLVRDVRVFDGQQLHAKRSVLIDQGKIVSADFHGTLPAGTTIVDGAGRTLLPGLIDAHTHTYQYAELPLLFGVTTIIDMFTPVAMMQATTAKMASGNNKAQSDMFSAGTLVTIKGGHGTEYGLPIPTLEKAEDAQAFVDARIAEGSYFIKIVMESGLPGHNKMPTLSVAAVKGAIDAAHKRGKLAVVHISSLKDARDALEMGADGLVHLFNGDTLADADVTAFVALAKQRKAFVIPTFSVMESLAGLRETDVLGDASLLALLNKEQRQPLSSTYGQREKPINMTAPKRLTAALAQAGVPVLAGTDAGNTGTQHGISLHHELASLVGAGMTPEQALAAATSAPATAFRLGMRGRIADGYKADLLLVEGNPAVDIGATRRIVAIWKDGETAAPLRAAQLAKVAEDMAPKVSQPQALPADGRISLFSKEKLASPFGMGWLPSTDSFLGGKSKVSLDVQEKGADGLAPLEIRATVAEGFAYPWAGVAFVPGKAMMMPSDLSDARVLKFRVRGDGGNYSVSMLAKGVVIPVNVPFTAPEGWKEVSIPMTAFKGVDASMVTMIAFNAGPKVGDYRFQLADIRLLGDKQ
jgi:imidazolonepropionase-like amidohydrolase